MTSPHAVNRPPSADKDKQLNLINPPSPPKPTPQPVLEETKKPKSSAPAVAPVAPALDRSNNAAPTQSSDPATAKGAAKADIAPLQMLVDAAEVARRAPGTAAGGAAAAAAAEIITTPTKPRETHGLMYTKPQSNAAASREAAIVSILPTSTSTPMKPQGISVNLPGGKGVATAGGAGASAGASAGANAGAGAAGLLLAARELTSDTDNFHDSVEQQQPDNDTSGIEGAELTAFQLALDKLQRDLNVTTNRVREVEFLLREQRSGGSASSGSGRSGGGGGRGAGLLNTVFGANADVVRTGLWLAWPVAVAWWMNPKETPLRRKY